MTKFFFWTLLALVCAAAALRGRRDERIAALVCLGATMLSIAVRAPWRQSYSGVEFGVLSVDLATLAVFVAVALRSPRFWPLWIAGLQLSTLLAHFFRAVDVDLIPRAYAAAERFWSYPILLIILVAALRSRWRYEEIERFESGFAVP